MSKIPETISYSSLNDFQYCPRFFELMNIKRVIKRQNSIETIFGNLVHKEVQRHLSTKFHWQHYANYFEKVWSRFVRMYKLDTKVLEYGPIASKVLQLIQPFFETHFPGYKVLHIEYKIKQATSYPQLFKGYIDIVIQTLDGKIVIIDFKTATSITKFEKYQDQVKENQLLLYKNYYSELNDVPMESISTYFMVFEKKLSEELLCLIPVDSSTEKLTQAEAWLNSILKHVNKSVYPKNLNSCLKFGSNYPCVFYKNHCK
jgi:hypothetical protein